MSKPITLHSRHKASLVALVDDEDYALVQGYKWFMSPQGYAWAHDYSQGWQAGMRGSVLMHRLIMGATQGQTVDHVNRNKTDNQRGNLRLASYSEQNLNTKTRSDNTSGHRGVYWESRRNCWRVCLNHDNKQLHVGQFKDKLLAIAAYHAKATEVYGGFFDPANCCTT